MRWSFGAMLLGVFLFVAIFGLPALLSHDGHHVGCPLQMASAVMCESTIVDHFSIWQAMFASMVSVLALFAGLVLFVTRRADGALLARERLRLRLARVAPSRPTMMQELYSRGILNRKESSLFS